MLLEKLLMLEVTHNPMIHRLRRKILLRKYQVGRIHFSE
jgi:hypothetical protein